MADPISYPGLIVSLLLPWFAGCVLMRWLLRESGRCNWQIVAGQGYFVGIFTTTLLIRLGDLAGWGLHFWSLAAALAGIAIIGIVPEYSRSANTPGPGTAPAASRWQGAVVTILLALLAWRYLTLVQEMLLRPLFAWDAWMNWAPKAIVWYHTGELTPFVSPAQWLDQGPAGDHYTLGNRQASTYPPGVPLIQLWSMLGAGTWDHSYLYLPWWLAAVNLGLALYGHLRVAGSTAAAAAIASYLLLSLPYLNVHTALAGYADIWLTACFSLAVFALHEWQESRRWQYATLCLFLAFMCAQLKNPGLVLAAIILLALARSALNAGRLKELAIALTLVLMTGVILVRGLVIDMPIVGRIAISSSGVSLPVLGDRTFEYHAVFAAFWRSMFFDINWNLLFYFTILAALFKIYRGDLLKRASNELIVLCATAVFLFVVFAFTRHYLEALNFVTINRALLYPTPVLVYYLFLQLHEHFHDQQIRELRRCVGETTAAAYPAMTGGR